MIYIVRVATGQEKITSNMLSKKAKVEGLNIYSILALDNIRGYIFVESEDDNDVAKLCQRAKNVRGYLKKPITLEEIKELIKKNQENKPTYNIGDIIEITNGPFKGEKAKIIKIDELKDEITVEFIDVAVPMPVTIKSKGIKIIKRN